MDGSLFTDNLEIYTTRSVKVETRALKGTANRLEAWTVKNAYSFLLRKTVVMLFKR